MMKKIYLLSHFILNRSSNTKEKVEEWAFVSKQLKKLWSKWLQFQAWWIKVKMSNLTFLSIYVCVYLCTQYVSCDEKKVFYLFFVLSWMLLYTVSACFEIETLEKWELSASFSMSFEMLMMKVLQTRYFVFVVVLVLLLLLLLLYLFTFLLLLILLNNSFLDFKFRYYENFNAGFHFCFIRNFLRRLFRFCLGF